jgi:hypothetical protein
MAYLIDMMKKLWSYNFDNELENGENYNNERKKEIVTGYILMKDDNDNRSLVLLQQNSNTWQTKWINNNSTEIRVKNEPIKNIFN